MKVRISEDEYMRLSVEPIALGDTSDDGREVREVSETFLAAYQALERIDGEIQRQLSELMWPKPPPT